MKKDMVVKALLLILVGTLVIISISCSRAPKVEKQIVNVTQRYLLAAQGDGLWVMDTNKKTICYFRVLGDGSIWSSRSHNVAQDLK